MSSSVASMASKEIRDFLEAVAEWRKSYKISFGKIGERTGLNPSTVYRALSGQTTNPTNKVLSAIAEAFGISLDEILQGEFRPEQIEQMGYSPLASKSRLGNRGISVAAWPGATLPLRRPEVSEPFKGQADGVSSKAESEYRTVSIEELGTIKMLGSPDLPNVPVDVLDTFVSLDITPMSMKEYREGLEPNKMSGEMDRKLSPESALQRAFENYRMLLILGDPGSGKTTLLKYYAMLCLKNRYRKLGFDKSPLPIYLPLREIESRDGEPYPLHECLARWASRHYLDISADMFLGWLKNRQTLILLDGLDEISDLDRRREICYWIDSAANGLAKACFVVTSRWTGYRKVDGIELEFDHIKADMRDFSKEQQKEFLEKWFVAVYLKEPRNKTVPKTQWRKRQKQKGKDKAKAIVDFLTEDNNKGIRELAVVPMLLQVIATLWRERENLPQGRAELYQSASKYLLDYRDRRRNIKPVLRATQALRVLCPVSFWMQEKLHTDEVQKQVLHEKMQPILKTMQNELRAEELCKNLRDRAGLLMDYNQDSYVFRHKTFREYLAGLELVNQARENPACLDRVVAHFSKDWWEEPLRFFMGEVDDKLFDHFMDSFFRSDVSRELDQKSYNLLLTMVREAPQRRIDSLERRLNDVDSNENQRRYIMDCLKIIGTDEAFETIKEFGAKEAKTGAGSFAQNIVAEERANIELTSEAATPANLFKNLPASFRNPFESNAEYICIPGGSFMYSVTKRIVQVPDIYFAKYPVTNKRYRRFISYLEGKEIGLSEILPMALFSERMLEFAATIGNFKAYLGTDPKQWAGKLRSTYDQEKRFKGNDQPVVRISWFAARAYCLWLSLVDAALQGPSLKESGCKYRLPMELEWEWAAGGGEREYPWPPQKGTPTEKLANYNDQVGTTTPVGRYPEGSTPEGLMDMAGNIREWMEDKYDKSSEARSLRGGSWINLEHNLRCSMRDGEDPDYHHINVGFRVVHSQS